MGIVISDSVIFDTGATYSCYYNKGDCVKLEEKTSSINLKGIETFLEISGFEILTILSGVKVDVGLRSRIRHIMFLVYQVICASFTHKEFAH